MTVIDRRAGRVLIVDPAGRTLLLHGGDPARPEQRWWFTPGGGLEEGETPAEGAARELLEETGLRVAPAELGEPVWHEVAEFSYRRRDYRQEQDFFLLQADEWLIDTAGMEDEEVLTITEHRWWSAAEIDSTTDQIFPAGLAGLLRRFAPPLTTPTGSAAASLGPAAASPGPAAASLGSAAVSLGSPAASPGPAAASLGSLAASLGPAAEVDG